jgi:hypothetical protein
MNNTFIAPVSKKKKKRVKKQNIKADYKYLLEEVYELASCNFNNSANSEYLIRILRDIQTLHRYYNEEKAKIREQAKKAFAIIDSELEIINIIKQQLLEHLTDVLVTQDKV